MDYWKSFNPKHLIRENAYKVGGGGGVDEDTDDDSDSRESETESNREVEGERESAGEKEEEEEEDPQQHDYHIPSPRADSESTYSEGRTKRLHEFRQGEDQYDDTAAPRGPRMVAGPSQSQVRTLYDYTTVYILFLHDN